LCAREAAVCQAQGEPVPNEQVEELRFGILEHQADALADASQRELLRAPTVDQDVTADLGAQVVRDHARQKVQKGGLPAARGADDADELARSEEHTSEL